MTSRHGSSSLDLDVALQPGAVIPAFQPIVDLRSGAVRAYEALARWPRLPTLTPNDVFTLAQDSGRLVELDWTCRVAALDAVLEVNPGDDIAVFVNIEPASVGAPAPQWLERRWVRDIQRVRFVLELTERSMLTDPAVLLRFVAVARDEGMGIALDDVGADPDSLAMLDLVAPDIVKLDLKLVQSTPAREQARTLAAVMAHQERTDAAVLAEGIETEQHREQAAALGADLGQGWLFGRPGPLPVIPAASSGPLRYQPHQPRTARTPFDVVRRHVPMRTAAKRLLVELTHHVEELAVNAIDNPMVLTALQTADQFSDAVADRYVGLAETSPLVGVFGRGLTVAPAPGVRGVALTADDPLAKEWTVVVLGARTAAALVALDRGDTGVDADRRFTFAVTHDRNVVTQAARALVDRLGPSRDLTTRDEPAAHHPESSELHFR